MITVSILIVNWNTRDILRGCLRSVYEQTCDIIYEVIVIDNASADGSAEMVKQEFPLVILIENTKNRGFAAANNQGIQIAKGQYILLLNSDTVVLDGAIQKSILFANQDLSMGVVGVRTELPDGTFTRDCFQFTSILNLLISLLGLHTMFPRNRFFGRERLTWWDYQSVREVDVVAGCYMLVRREAIELVGGMDEMYFMYGEEMDWCLRFKLAGWKVVYYPYAHIIHYGRQSSILNPNAMYLEQRKSYLYFYKKHYGQFKKFIAMVLLFLNGLFRFFYWTVRWPISQGQNKEKCKQKIRQSILMCFGV